MSRSMSFTREGALRDVQFRVSLGGLRTMVQFEIERSRVTQEFRGVWEPTGQCVWRKATVNDLPAITLWLDRARKAMQVSS